MTRGSEPRPAAGRKGWRFPGLLSLTLGVLLGLAVLMAFPERLLVADLVQHTRPQLALLALFCLGIALLRRRRRHALAALGLAALLGWPVVRSTLPPGWPGAEPLADRPAAEAVGLTLVSANVYIDNAQPQAMVEALLAADADVLVTLEFRQDWRELAALLQARYPHRWREGDITVWSRFPLRESRGAERQREFAVDVALEVGERGLRVLATHAPRPPDREILEERNWLFGALSDWVSETPLPVVVAGDFNATPWTPALRRLIDDEALTRARPPSGWYASWPTPLGDLGIPIDHLLYGKDAAVERFEVFEVPGSDHRALKAEILVP